MAAKKKELTLVWYDPSFGDEFPKTTTVVELMKAMPGVSGDREWMNTWFVTSGQSGVLIAIYRKTGDAGCTPDGKLL